MVNFGGIARRLFGSENERRIKRLSPKVDAINALEPEMEALSDDELLAKTEEFKKMVADGTNLEDLLVPSFAVVREASKRALGMRPFDIIMRIPAGRIHLNTSHTFFDKPPRQQTVATERRRWLFVQPV